MWIRLNSLTLGKAILFAMVAFVLVSCGYVGPSDPEKYMSSTSYSSPPTFAELNNNVFKPKCLSCHSSASPDFTSYDALLASGSVTPSNPGASTIYQQISSKLMPKGGESLAEDDIKAVYDWIAAGALSGGSGSTTAPDAPTSVSALATSATSALITWTLPSQTVTGVLIERATSSSGPFTPIATLLTSASSYTDVTLAISTTYYYRVSVSNLIGSSPTSSAASVTTPGYPPSAPSGLNAVAVSPTQIALTWTDTSSDETGFKIEQALSSAGPFTFLASVSANAASYSVTGLSGSTAYYYRVYAYNTANGSSSYSSVATATTLASPPNAPSGLTAVMASSAQINLSWTDNSSSEVGFKVERGATSTGPFTLVYTAPANTTNYSDTGLAGSTTYYYRVYAYSGAGNSSYTSVASATTQAPPPAAPSALAATATSATQINLTWSDNSGVETGFKIERGTSSSGPFTLIYTTAANATSFANTGLAGSTTYYYRIYAYNSSGNSAYTSVASATTQIAVAPSAPSALAAVAVSSSQINVTWTDNSSDETGFKIERGTSSSGPFSLVTTTASNAVSFADTGLSSSTTYYYRIAATNSAGDSAYTSVANATTQAPAATPPLAPSGLAATATSSTQINLSWTDNSTVETGFKIERGTSSSGPFSVIFTAAANSTSYSDTGLVASTTYYYRVYAYNISGNSSYTSVANATTSPPAPNAPSGLGATATSSTQINLAWTDNSTVETGFKIERGTSSSGPFTPIYTAAADSTSYSDTGLTGSTTYYYRVYAYNSSGNSAYSSVANATTQAPSPTAPSNLVATASSSTQINLTWSDNSSNETGFKVERSTSSGGTYTLIATLGANVTSYSSTGLSAATTYYYRVYAYNGSGNSSYSSIASADTYGTFSWVNANIVQPKCVSCHSGGAPKGTYEMSTYSGVMSRVVPNDSSGSLLYQRVLDGTMPKGSPNLTSSELNALKTWIDSGAANN